MWRWFALWSVVGCAAEAPLEVAPELDEAWAPAPPPPSPGPQLLVSDVVPGGTARLTVVGGGPLDTVHVVRGAAGSGPCPAALAGLCLDVTSPVFVASVPLDGAGNGAVDIAVPAGTPTGRSGALQGGVAAGAASYLTTVAAATTSAGCTDDGYEAVEGPGAPWTLAPGATDGLAACPSDTDHFWIEALAGDTVHVRVAFPAAEGNVDALLLDPDGGIATFGTSVSDDEVLDHVATTSGRFELQVGLITDAGAVLGNTYDVELTLEPGRWVSAGAEHTCVLDADGVARCMGRAAEGQLAVPPGPHTAIAAGGTAGTAEHHTCALDLGGAVTCWGSDALLQVSDAPLGTWDALTAGGAHTCALDSAGAVACWGDGTLGQTTPPGATFTDVSAGGDHTCGIDDLGALRCWGDDTWGQSSPPLGTWDAVAAGLEHTCALDSAGAIACFGRGAVATTEPAGTGYTALTSGSGHACAVDAAGDTACWGDDASGQATPPSARFARLSAGDGFTCGVGPDRGLQCWGLDSAGEAPSCIGSMWPPSAVPADIATSGLYRDVVTKELDHRVHLFTPQFPLWSDGSVKARWAYVPECGVIDNTDEDDWVVPQGTRLYKEFIVDAARVETRMIAHVASGELYGAYEWNAGETAATLWPAATGVPNAATYSGSGVTHDIPAEGLCIFCHGGGGFGGIPARALGFSAVQLSHTGAGLSMRSLSWDGHLSAPNPAGVTVPGTPDERAALGYLHGNCGNCHNALGEAVFLPAEMDFWLSASDTSTAMTGAYRTAVDHVAYNGVAPFRIASGSTADSAAYQRMIIRSGSQMPPVGSKVVDPAGVGAVETWILGL